MAAERRPFAFQMTVLGITGGIGMGKSALGHFLTARGIPVIDADEIARQESQPQTQGLSEIVTEFGPGIVSEDGSLNRKQLARLVFSDAEARRRLESILHPRIERRWRGELDELEEKGSPIAAVLIPLLFERRYERDFGCVIAVACTRETQRRRLLERGWSDREILDRNAAQFSIDDKMQRARFVIWTEGCLGTHERQLDLILGRLGSLYGRPIYSPV